MRRFFIALALLLLLAVAARAATVRSANFVVTAQTQEVARQCCDCAEQSRQRIAVLWLGRELPNWNEPCPVRITVVPNQPGSRSSGGGATSFGFGPQGLAGMSMNVEGPLDRLLAAVIPHEVCHTIFATYFQRPTPRCFDEGSAVTCEDAQEYQRHDRMCREYLNAGRAIPLARLFALTEYPSDVLALYAEGFSITNFLIQKGGRPRFLAFVGVGMREGWDKATRSAYGYQDVNALEAAWLTHLKATKGTAGDGRGEGGPAVPAVSPPATGTLAPTDTAMILATLAETQRQQAETLRLVAADVKAIKSRLDALERTRGAAAQPGTTASPQPWNQTPQRTQPTFAQPYAAPPSASPFVMPCPPGRQ